MSLNKDRLGNAIVDRILAESGLSPIAGDDAKTRALWIAIADEIIKELIANAVIKSDGATETHTSGAAADITALPGVIQS